MTQLQPTDEMVDAMFERASGGEFASDEDMLHGLAAVLAIVERDHIAPLRTALINIVDPDPCGDFDHHGNCQAHMANEVDGRCAHAVAKELLAAAAEPTEEP